MTETDYFASLIARGSIVSRAHFQVPKQMPVPRTCSLLFLCTALFFIPFISLSHPFILCEALVATLQNRPMIGVRFESRGNRTAAPPTARAPKTSSAASGLQSWVAYYTRVRSPLVWAVWLRGCKGHEEAITTAPAWWQSLAFTTLGGVLAAVYYICHWARLARNACSAVFCF